MIQYVAPDRAEAEQNHVHAMMNLNLAHMGTSPAMTAVGRFEVLS